VKLKKNGSKLKKYNQKISFFTRLSFTGFFTIENSRLYAPKVR